MVESLNKIRVSSVDNHRRWEEPLNPNLPLDPPRPRLQTAREDGRHMHSRGRSLRRGAPKGESFSGTAGHLAVHEGRQLGHTVAGVPSQGSGIAWSDPLLASLRQRPRGDTQIACRFHRGDPAVLIDRRPLNHQRAPRRRGLQSDGACRGGMRGASSRDAHTVVMAELAVRNEVVDDTDQERIVQHLSRDRGRAEEQLAGAVGCRRHRQRSGPSPPAPSSHYPRRSPRRRRRMRWPAPAGLGSRRAVSRS